MSTRRIAALTLALAGSVSAQPVGYRLDQASMLTQRYCLPPCLCPYREFTGQASGGFTLTRTSQDPLYTYYSITGFHALATLNGQQVEITAYGTYRRGGEIAIMQQLILYALVNGEPKVYDSGPVITDLGHPFPEISIEAPTEIAACRQDVLQILAEPDVSVCYPNCDGSTDVPVLNVNDFVCYQGRFAAGDPYANCDGSTQEPVLNVNDFVCFLTRFAEGCP